MRELIRRLFDRSGAAAAGARPRLRAKEWPGLIYAVGDVHGCADELAALERSIIADAKGVVGEKWIVMLGDYVDRGPRSADVLDRLCSQPPDGFKRFCLAGNHEIMMLDFLANPRPESSWLTFGGTETLESYGIDLDAFVRESPRRRRAIIGSHIPREHLEFVEALPVCLTLPGVTFVHAGLRPGVLVDDQDEDDLLWIREPFLSSQSPEFGVVVHGHTPGTEPVIRTNRIGIDTAAFATGVLTALRLEQGSVPAYLRTGTASLKAHE